MLKTLLKAVYQLSHDWLNACKPLWPRLHAGKPVQYGHISSEHLNDPSLDDELGEALTQAGIPVATHHIAVADYRAYLAKVDYPPSYYSGGTDPDSNFTEKTLEHFVSTHFLNFRPESVFIDIAACTSPFHQIVKDVFGVQTTYQQDLVYPPGLHGHRIGGYASELYLPDASVDAVTLHCSLEHFEDDSDTAFFQELERVLKPGGRAVILPFYLAHTYSIHVDPAYNLLKRHRPQIDPKAELRYCNWYQFFSRHYDPQALQRRILLQAPSLSLTVYRVANFREVDESCYLRWIGVFEKQ